MQSGPTPLILAAYNYGKTRLMVERGPDFNVVEKGADPARDGTGHADLISVHKRSR